MDDDSCPSCLVAVYVVVGLVWCMIVLAWHKMRQRGTRQPNPRGPGESMPPPPHQLQAQQVQLTTWQLTAQT